jgi:hypothetical protein
MAFLCAGQGLSWPLHTPSRGRAACVPGTGLRRSREARGRDVGSLPWLAPLVRPLPPGFTLPGIFCPSKVRFFPWGHLPGFIRFLLRFT